MKNKENIFYGRKAELDRLEKFLEKRTASLIVIRGRRRVGKSRLIDEFAKNFKTVYKFSGVPPTENTTATSQREDFSKQLTRVMGIPAVKPDDWGDLFWFMAKQIDNSKTLIVLDEITWMGDKNGSFLSKLQNIWETELKKHPRLIMIICGSVSAWIEKNILNSTGYVGRISLDMKLKELPLQTCIKFWNNTYKNISAYEIFKVLEVTGGIPWYLEQIHPKLSAEENIRNLAFTEGEVLFQDFNRIFTDVFGKRDQLYIDIIKQLIKQPSSQETILSQLDKTKSGRLGEYLDNLVSAGFITRDYSWKIATEKESKYSRYRLSDNYVRFYLKYIEPNKNKIIHGNFKDISLSSMSGWYSIMGLQFENLVLNNRHLIQEILGIKPEDIVYDNPYFQTKTLRREACQIDYAIQTRTNTLYVIEIKFTKSKVKSKIIDEMMQKISKLDLPKGFTVRPILIHVNGIENAVQNSDYFVKIIDFAALIENLRKET